MALVQDHIYEIKNIVFQSYIGIPSYQDPGERGPPIRGVHFDYQMSKSFTVIWTQHDHIVFRIDRSPVVEDEYFIPPAPLGKSRELNGLSPISTMLMVFVHNWAGLQPGSSLDTQLRCSPLNQVILAPRRENDHQLWELD